MTSPKETKRRWNRTQIRSARTVALAPLLARQGLQLQPLPDDNFRVSAYDDLFIKDHYWRWPSRGLEGNAIDFFVFVEGRSFAEALRLLLNDPA